MEHAILIVALFIIYFNIGGLATTNILRLTKGSTVDVLDPHCYCDNCDNKIPPLLQFPIISYILCGGRCKKCGIKIPKFPLVLEVVVISGMFFLTAIFHFSPLGVLCSFLYYEAVRVCVIKKLGRREADFKAQYKKAILSMVPFILCSMFVVFLYAIV